MKEYKIGNTSVYQDELNAEQDQNIAELFTRLDLGDISDIASLRFDVIIKAIAKFKALSKFLSIILTDKDGNPIPESLAGKIKNSQMEGIIKDFFSLNPKVRELLTNLKNALLSMNTISTLQDSEKNEVQSHPISQSQQ